MSWTIPKNEMTDSERDALEAAIRHAREKKILMFGAANDQGYNTTDPSYPATCPEVFCIGAAKLSGHVEEGAAKESQFVLPGGSVRVGGKSSRHATSPNADSELASGSSFATALAAGLTALILYCVELAGRGENREGLRELSVMSTIFKQMTDRDQPKYVVVDNAFNPMISGLSWDEGLPFLEDAVEKIIRYRPMKLLLEVQKALIRCRPWTDEVRLRRRQLSPGF
jgi:hypothetical protein